MVEYILIALLVAVLIAFFVCLWALVANEMAYRQRVGLIWCITTSEFDDFYSVSYDAHLWRVFTFRDPMKLYPAHFKDYV